MIRSALAAATGAAIVVAVAAHAAAGVQEVTMPGTLYAPGELDVLAGQTVEWRNTDSKTHTVTEDDDAFGSGYLSPGSTFSRTFASTGTFTYHCSIHRSMRGVVRVFSLILTGPPRPLPPAWAVSLRGISPTPGGAVVLERMSRGAVTQVAQTSAAADGSFAFNLRPTEPAAYRARAAEARSPVLRVTVKPNIALAALGSRLTVTTAPGRPGSIALLQTYDRDRFDWITVARAKLDAASKATFDVPLASTHTRVVVRGRDGWAAGISRTLITR